MASKEERTCPECGIEFDTPQGLGAHRYQKHNVKGKGTTDLVAKLNQKPDGELVRLAREVERLERELSLAVQALIDALETVAN